VVNEVRRRSTIEQALRHSGLCSDDQLEIGALEAERTGDDLAAVLIRLGFVSEQMLHGVSVRFRLPAIRQKQRLMLHWPTRRTFRCLTGCAGVSGTV